MKKILCAILCFVMLLSMAACSSGETQATVTVKDGQTIGEGAKSFPLEITDGEGNTVSIIVKTDAELVGDALLAVKLIAGEESEYGLYVKEVNGVIADYDVDGTYWAFYINGEYAMTGLDQTPIADGESYTLIVEG